MRSGQVRIIGGNWRSRRLRVPPGVRPTQDMQRESVFNVLRALDQSCHCLDLFAGSGSLGLEALSRGAGSATFVDSSARSVRQLRLTLTEFEVAAQVIKHDVLTWLNRPVQQRYNLVFVDPPYAISRKKGWWERLLASLTEHLAADARICLEGPAPIQLTSTWRCHRSGKNGAAHWCIITAA